MSKAKTPTPEQVEAAEAQIVEESKRIDFYVTEYSIELVAQKVRDGEYVVPSYQRAFTWEPERKSRFLESLIMGLPIPFIFFWEMEDGKLEIVDGSQRLRTIEEFVLGDFRLGELDPLTHVSGFQFKDLPLSRQRKVKNRSVRGIVLNEHADEAARLDMFERINTGSKIANKAEVRRGALAGPFMDLVIELSGSNLLAELAPMNRKSKDERGYEELVTRFFAYSSGLAGYRDRPSDFLFTYSKAMNKRLAANPEESDRLKAIFEQTLLFVDTAFPYGFRKAKTGRATPRARFEAIAIGSELALRENPGLAADPPSPSDVSSWLESRDFTEVTGADGANAVARLRGRINFVRDHLLQS